MPIRLKNNAGLNSKNIVNNVGIFSNNYAINIKFRE